MNTTDVNELKHIPCGCLMAARFLERPSKKKNNSIKPWALDLSSYYSHSCESTNP